MKTLQSLADSSSDRSGAQLRVLLGFGTDCAVLVLLSLVGLRIDIAQLISLGVAVALRSIVILNCGTNHSAAAGPGWRFWGKLLLATVIALSLRGAFVAFAMNSHGLERGFNLLIAALVANATLEVLHQLQARESNFLAGKLGKLPAIAAGVAGYVLLLRLLYAGIPNLLPEEAYYWNYSRHIDIGYRDHPPMVAWIIWLTTKLFGSTEIGVRFGALSCWTITAFACFKLARNLYDSQAGWTTILLLSVLPAFFGAGFMMTPDAPLIACWAVALYFIERATIGNLPRAWYGAGLALGLGLLSKYSMLLIVPSTLLFLILDPPGRKWFARRQPYEALLIAGVVFAPVVYWNAVHNWTSFRFQAARRLQLDFHFAFHVFLGHLLLLVTPAFLLGAALVLIRGARVAAIRQCSSSSEQNLKATRFAQVYCAVPLSVFAAYSCRHVPKINWSIVAWLAALPGLACLINSYYVQASSRWHAVLRKSFVATTVALTVGYGISFYFVALVIPETSLRKTVGLLLAWRTLGKQVEEVERSVERSTGSEPLIVGMDTNALSSELAFYDPDGDGAGETGGSNLFHRRSLMYSHWFPKDQQQGRNLVLVSRAADDLEREIIHERAERLGDITELVLKQNGAFVDKVYYRILYGYKLKADVNVGEYADDSQAAVGQ